MKYYDDKELSLKIFTLKFACISNDIDKKLFVIFDHTFEILANKLVIQETKKRIK